MCLRGCFRIIALQSKVYSQKFIVSLLVWNYTSCSYKYFIPRPQFQEVNILWLQQQTIQLLKQKGGVPLSLRFEYSSSSQLDYLKSKIYDSNITKNTCQLVVKLTWYLSMVLDHLLLFLLLSFYYNQGLLFLYKSSKTSIYAYELVFLVSERRNVLILQWYIFFFTLFRVVSPRMIPQKKVLDPKWYFD